MYKENLIFTCGYIMNAESVARGVNIEITMCKLNPRLEFTHLPHITIVSNKCNLQEPDRRVGPNKSSNTQDSSDVCGSWL